MGQPFVGQIALVGFNFAPAGWAPCDGRLLPISENETLFNLIGTTYGGDGQTTFALPDFRGRVPIHQGTLPGGGTYLVGEMSGNETVALTLPQIPAHQHGLQASATNPNGAPAATPGPSVVFATGGSGVAPYAPNSSGATAQTLAPQTIGLGGNSQPHTNIMPTLYSNYVISLFGIFPSP